MCGIVQLIFVLAIIWPTHHIGAQQPELSRCNKTSTNDGPPDNVLFRPIRSFKFNKPHDDEYMHIRVYVQTDTDANIFLTAGEPKPNYEILIAVHSNQMSQIRDANSPEQALAYKKFHFNSLSNVSHTIAIEIVARKDGRLQVFLPDHYKGPFMQYQNHSLFDLSSVSFANTAVWYYDCDFNPLEVETTLMYERLFNYIKSKATATMMTMPQTLTAVELMLQITEFEYQSHATLRTNVNFVLSWMDERLRWDPTKYNYKMSIQLPQPNIWTPTLWLLNSVRSTHCMSVFTLKIYANGTVVMKTKDVDLLTLCGRIRREWPNEYMLCDLYFGLIDYSTNYTFGVVPLRYVPEKQTITALNDWQCANVVAVDPGHKESIGILRIQMQMRRSYMIYTCIYAVPMLAAAITLLLSFRLRGIWRGVFILIAICILWAMDIVYLIYHTHLHYLPKLSNAPGEAHLHFLPTLCVFAYQLLQGIAVFCYTLHIAIMWLILYPLRAKPERSFVVTRILFCLSSADLHIYENDEEMKWYTVADRINDICCVFVSGCFVAITIWLIALCAAME